MALLTNKNHTVWFCFILLMILWSSQSPAQAQVYQDPHAPVQDRVEDLLARMSLDEKIGQMMQVDLTAANSHPADITSYYVGSILSGGDSDPTPDNTAATWMRTYNSLQARALLTPQKIPMIYGADAVHGHSNVYGATVFPHNIGLGCTRDSALIEQAARVTALEMAATGVDWNFGPCIAVARDERWGRTYEGFGETPELAKLGAIQVHGLQGDSLSDATSILACPKHFLADGGTTGGVDQGNAIGDEATIRTIFLPGYIEAIKQGAGSIMVSFSSINGQKMHGNAYWLTDVLKKELGFRGILVSDWGGVDQLSDDYKTAVQMAVNAGIDMVMLPTRYADFRSAMLSLYGEGKISIDRINDAVRRILTIKFRMGLFERPYADSTLLPQVGSAGHRAIARQCVRESLVLLKKKDGVLPLPKAGKRILVAGSHANNLGYQCGGWTITWQGGSGNITVGTTILQAMRNAAPGTQIDFAADGNFADAVADYSVVVIGETPYAEGRGYRSDLNIPGTDVDLVKKMKALGKPVVVVLVSGRPLILEKILHFSDAIVAAWLPGTEGGGVADVLFGDYAPQGLLSHSWPRAMTQIPLNVGDAVYAPLYEYGFGITSLQDPPAGSPPAFLSAIVGPDRGKIELTFSKNIDALSLSGATFALTRNGFPLAVGLRPALKEGDTTTVVLQLDGVFMQGDLVTIQYAAGSIRSADGGVLAPFGPIPAYNWVSTPAINVPAKIDADGFSDMAGVQIGSTMDQDGGMDLASLDKGDWVEYSIKVPTPGYYYLSLRTVSASTQGMVALSNSGRSLGSSIVPVTGSWGTYSTQKQLVSLSGGVQTLRLDVQTGGFRLHWLAVDNLSAIEGEQSSAPLSSCLDQNYPNPFNPKTVVSSQLPVAGHVMVAVYDLLGREVAVLVNERRAAGRYQDTFDGSGLSSGFYIYRLTAGTFVQSRTMQLVK